MSLFQPLKQTTIRWRLTIIFATSAILTLLSAGYLIYTFSANFRKNEFKLRLQNRLHEVQEIMRRKPNGPLPEFSPYDEAVLPREQLNMLETSDTIKISNYEGRLRIPKSSITLNGEINFFQTGYRDVAILYDDVLKRFLVVSAIDVYGYTKMSNLRKVIMVCLLCSVVVLAFISWYWTRKMLAPIASKIEKARLIGTSSLNLRLEVKNPADELGLLAQTFNQMLDRLEKGFKAQQQFIGNASHELRTPLTVLRTEAEWALDRQRTTEDYQEVLRKVLDKSVQLGHMVNRLLILARIEGPQMVSDLQTFRLDELVLQTVEELQGEQSLVPVKCLLENESENHYLVQGDRSMVQTALNNLLDNALKYGLNQPVTVSVNLQDKYYCVTVQDKGIGISPEEMEHLFEPFYRSSVARNTAKGTGLGLSLVEAVVKWHGGHLEVNSIVGDTSFSMYLPKYQ